MMEFQRKLKEQEDDDRLPWFESQIDVKKKQKEIQKKNYVIKACPLIDTDEKSGFIEKSGDWRKLRI